MAKNAEKVVEGEDLNILVGSIPLEDEEKEPVKKRILEILKENIRSVKRIFSPRNWRRFRQERREIMAWTAVC